MGYKTERTEILVDEALSEVSGITFHEAHESVCLSGGICFRLNLFIFLSLAAQR